MTKCLVCDEEYVHKDKCTNSVKNPHGFANWDKEKLRQAASKGGKNGNTGGFYANKELAASAGRIGGKISKRRPKRYVVIEGETMDISSGAYRLNISKSALYNKIKKGQIENGSN